MALTAEHLVVIGRGRLLADTTVEQFIADNSKSYVRIATPDPARLREVLTAEGIQVTDTDDGALAAHGVDPARVGELAAAHGVVVHEIAQRSASLEEAFVQMTGESVEFGR
jgi:ABC-2 type transport system ATP-binding protein